jgi:hypothetical protein
MVFGSHGWHEGALRPRGRSNRHEFGSRGRPGAPTFNCPSGRPSYRRSVQALPRRGRTSTSPFPSPTLVGAFVGRP